MAMICQRCNGVIPDIGGHACPYEPTIDSWEAGYRAGRRAERVHCNEVVQNFYKTFQQSPPNIDIAENSLKVEANNVE